MVQVNFDQYYSYKDTDSKNLFLSGRIRPVPAKRPRNKETNPEGRINYDYIINYGQEEHNVCKTAFLSIFVITKSTTDHIIKTRKAIPAGTPKPDARGRGK